MLKNYTKQDLDERYQKLPTELQEALYSFDIADRIFETGKKYGLSIEKISKLAGETGYVILGVTGPREFVKTLTEGLGLTIDKTRSIASDINREVFAPIRGMLKRTHNVDFTEEDIQHGGEEILRKAPAPITATPTTKPESRPIIPESKPTFPGITPIPKTPPIDLRGQEPPRPILTPKPEVSVPPPAQKLEEKAPEIPIPPTSTETTRSEQARPQPSWILSKPVQPTPVERATEISKPPQKDEMDLVAPPSRLGPKIPPIDLRKTPQEAPQPTAPTPPQTSPKPVPQPYKGEDPYKEPIE